jgi:O-antigen/teichoic acid export membrane protein
LDFNDIPFVQIYVFIITISLIIANTLSFVQPFLIAMEKNFIIVFYENIFFLILVFFQYFTFLHTKSILFYFLLQGLITIVPKFLIKTYFNKKFPEILAFDKTIIKSRIQNFNLFKSVQILFPILIIKFVAMVINNIDVIVTASLINLDKLGVYSNYLLIVAIINQLLEQFQKVLMPAFNRFQSNKNGKPYNYFLNLFKFNFYLILFISIFLSLFLNPFLRFWFGGNLILDSTTTTLIIFGFFSSNLRRPFWIFNQINGYYNSFILNSFIELTLLTLFSLILFPIYNLAGLVLGINFSRIISYFYTEINVFVNKKFILHKFKFSLLYIFYISSGALILFSLVQFSTFFSIQISLLLFLFLFSILLLFSFRGLKSLLIYY